MLQLDSSGFSFGRNSSLSTVAAFLFLTFLLVGLILQNTKAPLLGAYLITTLAYGTGGLIFAVYTDGTVKAKSWSLALFVAFAATAVINYLFNPELFNLVRLLVLFVFVPANFYMIPSFIKLKQFLYIISRIGALLVVVGLLPLVGFPTQLGIINLSLWVPFSPFDIPVITSVFVNPNQLGFFTLIGAIAALSEQYVSESTVPEIVLWVNTFGLILSHYRTGWIALLSALGLWYVYSFWGREAVIITTVGGITSIVIGLSLLFGVLPAPQAVTDISLNGRRELWVTSVHAFQQEFVIGQGFLGTNEIVGSPHNSFLRIFASFGVVGGLLYTVLVAGVTVESARQTISLETYSLTALLVAMLIVQMFNQLSFIGISMRSSIIAIIMGYYMFELTD